MSAPPRPSPPHAALLGLLSLALSSCVGYQWSAPRAPQGAARLPLEDLTGAPGLARALERAARVALAPCPPVRAARLSWGAAGAAPALLAPADPRAPLPPPAAESIALELRFDQEPPLRVELSAPRLSAPLSLHPSALEEGSSGGGARWAAEGEGLAARLARKAGDECALRR